MRLTWDEDGKRLYETGVRNAVLYKRKKGGAYDKGVAWNGITGITENPTGAEATALYADDIKYLNLVSAEELEATIEAYTYPDEFAECDGSANLEDVPGLVIGQQDRTPFAICYRTMLGNDTEYHHYGYKLHIMYGCIASPAEKAYATINDSPDAITFSWNVKTTPVLVEGYHPTSLVTIDSTKVDPVKLKALEDALYGTESAEARLLMPAEIAEILK